MHYLISMECHFKNLWSSRQVPEIVKYNDFRDVKLSLDIKISRIKKVKFVCAFYQVSVAIAGVSLPPKRAADLRVARSVRSKAGHWIDSKAD